MALLDLFLPVLLGSPMGFLEASGWLWSYTILGKFDQDSTPPLTSTVESNFYDLAVVLTGVIHNLNSKPALIPIVDFYSPWIICTTKMVTPRN